ncbi:hypothetical protein GCM10010400_72940 [Streptomyces aculeolatus]|uniref:hypothetical protein n=1 Tax=Streptomyces aculeolatus TaxID=270689 RepID=UPI001CEC3A72|nr:hypothetical protein [Streptomyces aculeolatus]
MDEQRVFLVKPGDLLVFGNVGEVPADSVQALSHLLREEIGVRAVVFAADIDMAAVPGGDA